MTEAISIVFFLIGLGLVMSLRSMFVRDDLTLETEFLKPLAVILFFFIWNSEYVATSITLFAILYYISTSENKAESLNLILKNFLYVLIFTFILRKIKDFSIQQIIDNQLQNIK